MRVCRELSNLLFVVLIVGMASQAFSARKISFQAKIVKPDGTYLASSAVNFKFTLTDPSGNCVLYSEIFNNVDMSTTEGSVLFLLGDGTRSYPTSGGMNWVTSFDNKVASYTCGPPSTSTYTPAVGDSRKLYVQFNDGSSSGAQLLPAMDIGAVPFAMYADSASALDTHPATDFVLKTDVSTCAGAQVLTFNGTSFS